MILLRFKVYCFCCSCYLYYIVGFIYPASQQAVIRAHLHDYCELFQFFTDRTIPKSRPDKSTKRNNHITKFNSVIHIMKLNTPIILNNKNKNKKNTKSLKKNDRILSPNSLTFGNSSFLNNIVQPSRYFYCLLYRFCNQT